MTKESIFEFEITLRGQECTVAVYSVAPADPSVGIMGVGMGDYAVFNSNGDELLPALTDDEQEEVNDRFNECYEEPFDEDFEDFDEAQPPDGAGHG